MLSYKIPFLLLFSTLIPPTNPQENTSKCTRHLGVEFNQNQLINLKLTSSVSPQDAGLGRLNNQQGSWCFTYEQLNSEDISFSIDLGVQRLITGFATQGPPKATISSGYSHNIPFIVNHSVDEVTWKVQDSGQEEFQSFADDKEPNTVQEHLWNECVLARYVKFTVDKSNTIISEKGCLRFEILGCGEELQPNVSFKLDASGSGRVELSWNVPTVWTGNKWSPLGSDNFLVSFEDVRGGKVELKSEDGHSVTVLEPYFGAEHHFNLNCQVAEMKFNCGSLTTFLYPSCPKNWIGSGSSCFYSDSTKAQWPAVRDKCLHVDPKIPSSDVALNTSIWLGKQTCLDYRPIENIIDQQCCGSLQEINTHSSTIETNYCSADDIKPFTCLIQHKMHFCKVTSLQVTSLTDNSIKISWQNIRNACWLVKNRKILIFKSSNKWTDDLTSDENQSGEELPSDDWQTVDNTNPTNFLEHSNVQLNGLYSIIVVPLGSDNRKDVYKTQFHQLSIGAIMSVGMNSFINWNGIIKVEWEQAMVRNNQSATSADGYTIQWSNEATHFTANTSLITNLYFDIDLPSFEDDYDFILFCHFKTIAVQCGRTHLHIGGINYKHVKDGSKTRIYSHNFRERSWPEASEMCKKQGGHLTSVADKAEYELITKMTINKESFWLGGTNCGGKALKTWVDGLRWTYAVKMKNFKNEYCCLQAAYVENEGFIWEGSLCDVPQAYVCKFELSAVTAPVVGLRTEIISPSQILLHWTPPTKLWQPTHFAVYKCSEDSKPSCTRVTTVKTSKTVLVENLQPNTKYKFIVDSFLSNLNTSSRTEISEVTSEQNIETSLTREGVLKVKWSKKIREGKNNVACKITASPTKNPEGKITVKGTAKELLVTGLNFNTEYQILIETEDGTDNDTMVLKSIPQCERAQRQKGLSCYQLLPKEYNWENAKKQCSKEGLSLIDGSDLQIQLLSSVISQEVGKEIWLGHEPVEGNCKKTNPSTQDPLTETCDSELSTLCQTEIDIILLPVTSLSVVEITETTVKISWSPPKSWRATHYQVILEGNGVRSKRNTPKAMTVTTTSAEMSGLQSGTQYKVSVTPIIQSKLKSDASQTKGKTESIEVSTQKTTTLLQLTTPSAQAAVALTLSTTLQIMPEQKNVTFPEDLATFHIIGCATLIGLIGIALFLFIICRMYHFRDVSAQVGFEMSIIVVYCLFLIWGLDSSMIHCQSMAICVHFFYTASFSFLLVEAITICKATTTHVPIGFLQKNWHCFAIGWIPPLITIGCAVGFLMDNYPTEYPCWTRYKDENLLYATAIPNGILGGLCLCFLLLSICFRPSSNYEVDEESYTRESVMQMTRWILLLLLGLLTASWSCGMMGTEDEDQTLLLIYIIATILLGVSVLILRYFGDAEARHRFKNLCSDSKVGPDDNLSEDGLVPYKTHMGYNETSPPSSAFIEAHKRQLMINRYVYFP